MSISGPGLAGLLNAKERHERFTELTTGLPTLTDTEAVGRYMSITVSPGSDPSQFLSIT